jgi:hypothetical protein
MLGIFVLLAGFGICVLGGLFTVRILGLEDWSDEEKAMAAMAVGFPMAICVWWVGFHAFGL